MVERYGQAQKQTERQDADVKGIRKVVERCGQARSRRRDRMQT